MSRPIYAATPLTSPRSTLATGYRWSATRGRSWHGTPLSTEYSIQSRPQATKYYAVGVDRRLMALSYVCQAVGPELSYDEAFHWSVRRRQASSDAEELFETPRLLSFVKNRNRGSKRCKMVRSRTDSPTVISSRMLNLESRAQAPLAPLPPLMQSQGGASTSRTTGPRKATTCIVSGCNFGPSGKSGDDTHIPSKLHCI